MGKQTAVYSHSGIRLSNKRNYWYVQNLTDVILRERAWTQKRIPVGFLLDKVIEWVKLVYGDRVRTMLAYGGGGVDWTGFSGVTECFIP